LKEREKMKKKMSVLDVFLRNTQLTSEDLAELIQLNTSFIFWIWLGVMNATLSLGAVQKFGADNVQPILVLGLLIVPVAAFMAVWSWLEMGKSGRVLIRDIRRTSREFEREFGFRLPLGEISEWEHELLHERVKDSLLRQAMTVLDVPVIDFKRWAAARLRYDQMHASACNWFWIQTERKIFERAERQLEERNSAKRNSVA